MVPMVTFVHKCLQWAHEHQVWWIVFIFIAYGRLGAYVPFIWGRYGTRMQRTSTCRCHEGVLILQKWSGGRTYQCNMGPGITLSRDHQRYLLCLLVVLMLWLMGVYACEWVFKCVPSLQLDKCIQMKTLEPLSLQEDIHLKTHIHNSNANQG